MIHAGENPYMGEASWREFWFDLRHPGQMAHRMRVGFWEALADVRRMLS